MAYKGTSCSAAWCKNIQGCCSRFGKNISFFRFPKDASRAKQWIKFCLREDLMAMDVNVLRSIRVCGDHFLDSDYIRKWPSPFLKKTAIPTVMDVVPESGNSDERTRLEDANSMTTEDSFPSEESFASNKISLSVLKMGNKMPRLETDPLRDANRMTEIASPPYGESFAANGDTMGSLSEVDVKPNVDTLLGIETEQTRADRERIMKHPYECCRLCLERSDDLTDIFEETELALVIRQAIRDFLHFEVVRKGKSPWQVCYSCMQKLSDFQEFKDRCVETKIVWDDYSKYIDEDSTAYNTRSSAIQIADNDRFQPELHGNPDEITEETDDLLQHVWKDEEKTGNDLITMEDGDSAATREYSLMDVGGVINNVTGIEHDTISRVENIPSVMRAPHNSHSAEVDGQGCESHLNPVHQNTEPSSVWPEDKENSTTIQVKGIYELDDSKGSDGEPLVLILKVDGAVELCTLSEIPPNMRSGIQKYSKMTGNHVKKRPREKGD